MYLKDLAPAIKCLDDLKPYKEVYIITKTREPIQTICSFCDSTGRIEGKDKTTLPCPSCKERIKMSDFFYKYDKCAIAIIEYRIVLLESFVCNTDATRCSGVSCCIPNWGYITFAEGGIVSAFAKTPMSFNEEFIKTEVARLNKEQEQFQKSKKKL